MVRDDDVEPRGAGGGDLVDRGDRAVDRDEQLRPARGEPLDRAEREPVAVVDPAREIPVDVGADRAQRAHEHRGRAHPVDVVVAVDRDPRAAAGVVEDARRALAQAAERVERMAHARVEERPGRIRRGEAAPHEHLGDDVRHAEVRREPAGGGVVVGRDVEADLGRCHGADRTARAGRNRRVCAELEQMRATDGRPIR